VEITIKRRNCGGSTNLPNSTDEKKSKFGGINFGGSEKKNLNWPGKVLAVEDKFHFWWEEILADFGGFLVKPPNPPKS